MAAAAEAPAESPATPVVMCVGGPVAPEKLPQGPALCREWLLNDQSKLLVERAGFAAGTRLELQNALAMRRWPLCSLHNLHLSSEDAVREVLGPFRRSFGGGLIVITTPRAFWNVASASGWSETLRSFVKEAERPELALVVGTAPAPGCPATAADFEVEVAKLESDLAIGFEAAQQGQDCIRPGFIGELCLPAEADEAALSALRVCAEAQRRTGAPMLLSGSVSEEALGVLMDVGAVWEKCAFFDVPPDSPVAPATLAELGAFLGFCSPPGAADVAWQPYPARRPWKTEPQFLSALSGGPAGRTLISSGVRFRTDIVQGGGPGLCAAPELLAEGLPSDELPAAASFREAAISFLQYPWKPPPPPVEVIRTVECHWCGTRVKEGDHFSKFQFDYCAPKCLGQHRKAEFAEDKRGPNYPA